MLAMAQCELPRFMRNGKALAINGKIILKER